MNIGNKIFGMVFVIVVLLFGVSFGSAQFVACTEDAKVCSDGSVVSRIAPNCEFTPCPSEGDYITDRECDACNACSDGLVCVAFPGIESRCAQPDPCSYYECSGELDCQIGASPAIAQICSDGDVSSNVLRVVCGCSGPNCPDWSGGDHVVSPDLGVPISNDGESGDVMIGDSSHSISIRNRGDEEGEIRTGGGYNPDNIGVVVIDSHSVGFSNDVRIVESRFVMETSAGDKEISVLPEEAIVVSESPDFVMGVELREESERPVYFIKGEKPGKMFGVFPLMMEVETGVNAGNGEVVLMNKPWWSFLVSE